MPTVIHPENPKDVLDRIIRHAGSDMIDASAWESNSQESPNNHMLLTGRVSGSPTLAIKIGCEACILTPTRVRALAAFLLKEADKADASAARWMERHTNEEGHYTP